MSFDKNSNYQLSDESFFVYTSHVEKSTKEKIFRGEFVELEKLIPKSKITKLEDKRLELANKEGMSYFMPIQEKEIVQINSFKKWEKAFWVYAGVYTQANPDRSNELLQYISTIETANDSFIWDNVYSYDIIFRKLMAEFPR